MRGVGSTGRGECGGGSGGGGVCNPGGRSGCRDGGGGCVGCEDVGGRVMMDVRVGVTTLRVCLLNVRDGCARAHVLRHCFDESLIEGAASGVHIWVDW